MCLRSAQTHENNKESFSYFEPLENNKDYFSYFELLAGLLLIHFHGKGKMIDSV